MLDIKALWNGLSPIAHGAILGACISVIGAIVAALLSFVASWLSNRASLARQDQQFRHNLEELDRKLAHESGEAKKNRLSDIRRDVYMPAAETLAKAASTLGSLVSESDPNLATSTTMKEVAAATNKVAAVAEQQTARLVREINVVYVEAFGRLLVAVAPLAGVRSAIDVHKTHYAHAQQEIRRILDARTALLESGQLHEDDKQRMFEALGGSMNICQKLSSEHQSQLQNSTLKLAQAQLALYDILIPELDRIVPLQNELMGAVRSELELETDLAAFQEQSKEHRVRMMKLMEQTREFVARAMASSETVTGDRS